MNKIVIKEKKEHLILTTSKMEPQKLLNMLSRTLVASVKEYTCSSKEEFLKIIGKYYDNE